MITLGPIETVNINRMITITSYFHTVIYCYLENGTFEIRSRSGADNINRYYNKLLPLYIIDKKNFHFKTFQKTDLKPHLSQLQDTGMVPQFQSCPASDLRMTQAQLPPLLI